MTAIENDKAALVQIAAAFDLLCPKEHQGAVWRLVSEMKADGTHEAREQSRVAISMLYDGLTYGNWLA